MSSPQASGPKAPGPQTPATPAHVAELATTTSKSPVRGLFLLGIFGTTDSPKAMIRQTSGRILSVSVGDLVSGRKVQAIGEDTVYLTRANTVFQLHLP